MKVLIIRPYPSIVNLKSNTYNQQEIGLAKGFLTCGLDVGIVYFGGNNNIDDIFETEKGTIKIYYRKAKKIMKIISIFDDFSDLKDEYDLLVISEYDQIETYKTIKKYPYKTIVYHGPYYEKYNKRYNIYNKIYDFLYLRKIKKIAPYIFTKSELAKEYLNNKGLDVIDAIGVGLDKEQLQSKENEEEHPISFLIDESKVNLLYVGRFEKRRNIPFILNVLKEIVKYNQNYRLVAIGTGEKNYINKVNEYIERNDLSNYIIYKDKIPQKQLKKIYQKCDYLLLPTEYEIWEMVIMEAMLCGCKVITTRNGGSSSLIDDKNGKVLKLDVKDWLTAIGLKVERQKIQSYNDEILSNLCDWNKIASKILSAHIGRRKQNDKN